MMPEPIDIVERAGSDWRKHANDMYEIGHRTGYSAGVGAAAIAIYKHAMDPDAGTQTRMIVSRIIADLQKLLQEKAK